MRKYLSPNYNKRRAAIKYLMLHYTGMATGDVALSRMCDPAAEVSAHYMIDEAGEIFYLVAEEMRAWHAGVSSFEGEKDLNSCSIGIELVNKGHAYDGYAGGYIDFPEAQMQSLIKLCKEILARHDIKPWHVVAHSDVAPLRKIDPGEKFDWQRLSAEGIGVWPKIEIDILAGGIKDAPELKDALGLKDMAGLKDKLQSWGYDYLAGHEELTATICAFQRHFRPQNFSGEFDRETMAILDNLLLQKQR